MDRSEAERRGPKAPETRPRRREAGAQRAQSEHDSRKKRELRRAGPDERNTYRKYQALTTKGGRPFLTGRAAAVIF